MSSPSPSKKRRLSPTDQPSLASTAQSSPEEPPSSSSDDDDDEAPETQSTSFRISHKPSPQVQSEAALAERQSQKAERRALDDRRKKTAARREYRRAQRIQASLSSSKANPTENSLEREIPDLLPDDILNDDSFAKRLPTPPPETHKKTKVEEKKSAKEVIHRTIVKFDEQAEGTKLRGQQRTKDGAAVKVLRRSNAVLPGKAQARTRSIREGWLDGRRGALVAQRRAVNKGFLVN